MIPQHERISGVFEQLFELLGDLKQPILPEKIPFPIAKIWFSTVESMCTVMLLTGLKLAAPFSIATGRFAAAVKARWLNAKPLDFFADLQTAMAEKDTSGHGTSGGGRGAGNSFRGGVALPG